MLMVTSILLLRLMNRGTGWMLDPAVILMNFVILQSDLTVGVG